MTTTQLPEGAILGITHKLINGRYLVEIDLLDEARRDVKVAIGSRDSREMSHAKRQLRNLQAVAALAELRWIA